MAFGEREDTGVIGGDGKVELAIVVDSDDTRSYASERARAVKVRDDRLRLLNAELDGPISHEEREDVYIDIDFAHRDYDEEIVRINKAYGYR